MKIILKRVLEYLLLSVFCIVIIFGNIFLVYNLKNKFVNFNEKYNIEYMIKNAEQVSIKDVENNKEISIDNDKKKSLLIDKLSKLSIRKNKMKIFINNDNKIDYSLYITDLNQNETIINFRENIIDINSEISECDYNTDKIFEEIFELQ